MIVSPHTLVLHRVRGRGEGGGGEKKERGRCVSTVSYVDLLLHPSTSSSILSNESSYCLSHTGCEREGGREGEKVNERERE